MRETRSDFPPCFTSRVSVEAVHLLGLALTFELGVRPGLPPLVRYRSGDLAA